MRAQNISFYVGTTLIWGSTWLAIKYQIDTVDPLVSVVYRFALAALVLFAYCFIFRLNLRFSFQEHLFIALQGIIMFGVNYWLVYEAETQLPSGLVAVVFSMMVFMNVINGVLFLNSPIRKNVVIGALLGISGLILIFWPELSAFKLANHGFYGLILSVIGAYTASLGNILSARNQRKNLPIIQTNAFGMAYGTIGMLLCAIVTKRTFHFDTSPAYMISLFYLAIAGSVIAFGMYLTLIGRIGADKAGYNTLVIPIVALALSTVFEGYHWTLLSFIGTAVIVMGNFMVLNKKILAKQITD
jgi:drug/metabolite transporter (DMT)-like permease